MPPIKLPKKTTKKKKNYEDNEEVLIFNSAKTGANVQC
jgi:hypothetical protein